MITTFPIIQNFQQSRKNHLKLQRENICTHKFDHFRRKMVKNVKELQNFVINNQMLELDKDCLTLVNRTQRRNWIKSASMQKCQQMEKIKIRPSPHSHSLSKKNKQAFNKNFNRSKTDWQHNFVGTKYLQKIKQQFNKTKCQGVKNEQKISFSTILHKKCESIQLFDSPGPNSFNLKTQHKISREQFERIKQYKQKKKIKVKNQIKLGTNQNKREQSPNFNKACHLFQNYQPLQPWDDYSCNISSVIFSKI